MATGFFCKDIWIGFEVFFSAMLLQYIYEKFALIKYCILVSIIKDNARGKVPIGQSKMCQITILKLLQKLQSKSICGDSKIHVKILIFVWSGDRFYNPLGM